MKTSEVVSIPRGFGSKHERGVRWFAIWNLRTKKKDNPQILCKCGKLLTVRPKADGIIFHQHLCGFEATLKLEEYTKNKC